MKTIAWIFLYCLASLTLPAQIPDSSLLKDQNPNHYKSKEKYTKPATSILKEKTKPLALDTPKHASPALNNTAVTGPEAYLKNLKAAEEKKDLLAVSNALSALGSYYYLHHDPVSALTYYQKALKIAETFPNKKTALETLLLTGDIYYRQQNQTKAEEYYQRVFVIAKATGDSQKIKQAGDALSKIFATKGNYKNAYEMSLLLKQVTDSLNKNETRQRLLQARFSYDSLKRIENEKNYQKGILQKQAQIENSRKITYLVAAGLLLSLLLAFSFYKGYKNTQKTNRMIDLQKREAIEKNSMIENSLAEKETLLKEIHHRVKNNLQIISSLLNLQANRTDDEGLKRIMSEAKNRINSMALIHQKVYQSGNLSSIDFQAYIEQMAQSMEMTYNTQKKEITYRINTNGIVLDIDTSIPLGLIINELLTNIYKYAFINRDAGIITISLEKKNNEEGMELHISDNGIGLPPGFDMNALDSLGLKLVKGLSNQLKGTLRFENNHGTHCYIKFNSFN